MLVDDGFDAVVVLSTDCVEEEIAVECLNVTDFDSPVLIVAGLLEDARLLKDASLLKAADPLNIAGMPDGAEELFEAVGSSFGTLPGCGIGVLAGFVVSVGRSVSGNEVCCGVDVGWL